MVGYIPRRFACQQTVTHPSSNCAQCRATALIETNVLPLHHTATVICLSVCLSVHLSVTNCTVVNRVSVGVCKLYCRVPSRQFIFTSSDTCCLLYHLATKLSELADRTQQSDKMLTDIKSSCQYYLLALMKCIL